MMHLETRGTPVRTPVRVVLAAITWAGVLLQLVLSLRLAQGNGGSVVDGLVAYFGYFTVLTNLFVALVLSVPMIAARSSFGRFLSRPGVAACAAVSILLVGVGYHVLLRHVWNPQGLQWVADMVLHYVVPLTFYAFWLLKLSKAGLRWTSPLWWCVYPLAYFAYALLRGQVLRVYPYYFLDMTVLGFARVLANASVLLCLFALAGVGSIAVARLLGRLGIGEVANEAGNFTER